jgi:exosortase/archaeosortase family protein
VLESQKGKRYAKFAVYFLITILILQIITHLKVISQPLTYLTTQLTFHIIHLFYKQITLNGYHILGGINMEIIYECTGIYGIIVFSSAVLSTWFISWEKCKAILLVVPQIYILNLIRLVTIFLISQKNPKLFDIMHTFFWQLFLLFFVVYFFYAWLQTMLKKYP